MNDYVFRLKAVLHNKNMHILLFAIIGILLYFQTFPYPFVFDDRVLIINNQLIRHSSVFFDLFDINNFLPEYLPRVNDLDTVTSFAMRPVAYITFRLNFLLGGENPAGYRAFNIFIHIANAIMLYHFLLAIIRRRLEGNPVGSYLAIPFFASLLFLVHPLQTESVTYVVQRFTSLGTFFYLATLLLYLLSCLNRGAGRRLALYFASLCALMLGMLTKEFSFTIPISLLVIERFLFRLGWRETLYRSRWHLICLPIIPLVLLFLSNDIRELGLSQLTVSFNGYSRFDYALTQVRVILSYLRLLVLPYSLNFDPDYTLFQRVTDPEIILSLLLWCVLGIAALRRLKHRKGDIADDLVSFSIIWFPLLICVASSVVPLPDLMSEHRTYLPSLAFCTGMTAYLYSLSRHYTPAGTRWMIVAACAIIGVFSLLTLQRNQVYSSRLSLWSDTAAKSPKKARPALAVGNAYSDMGQYEMAISWLKRSIALNPDYKEPYLSLGNTYTELGRNYEAIGLYETYLESHPPGPRILNNLAQAYYEIDMPNEAIACLKTALTVDSDDEKLHLFIAELLYITGRRDEAHTYIEKAKMLDKNNPILDVAGMIMMLEQNYKRNPVQNMPHRGAVHS